MIENKKENKEYVTLVLPEDKDMQRHTAYLPTKPIILDPAPHEQSVVSLPVPDPKK